jgi:Flp pilus assembly protein TadD
LHSRTRRDRLTIELHAVGHDVIGRIGPATLKSAQELHEEGVDHECAGRLDEAIAAYRLALQVGGPDVQVIFDLAYALDARGDYAAAAERYMQIIEINPKHVDAHINLADTLLNTGEVNLAIRTLQQAIALAPIDASIRQHLASLAGRHG